VPEFIPGLQLSGIFYAEAVKPILDTHIPGLPHTACRIDSGSEVLGFDTEMSRDHDWGLRLQLFLPESGPTAHDVDTMLSRHLPPTVRGYSTHFEQPTGAEGVPSAAHDGMPIKHRVHCGTVRTFFWDYLHWDIDSPLTAADWLTFPTQHLRTITQGAIYHDALGLGALRQRFAFYPHDAWLYVLAAGWNRIGQEEHLMPRAGYVGDELGSAVIGSRLIRDMMRLGFLMEKHYPPYPKWFGTAFQRLNCASVLAPLLRSAQQADTWSARADALAAASEHLAAMHNQLGLTAPLPATTTPFFTRPFRVIWGGQFAAALIEKITDPAVKAIAAKTLIGSVDQFIDSTDALFPALRHDLRSLYQTP